VESTSEFGGLCSNCKHTSTCTYPRDPNRPVTQCEEYGCSEPAPAVAKPKAGSSPGCSGDSNTQEQEQTRHVGLCCNCANRDTCVFPKPEGGVWHCQEYQ